MIESIFIALYEAMTGSIWLALLASFGWGKADFGKNPASPETAS